VCTFIIILFCPIIQQDAHLRQYNGEEQDSKVRLQCTVLTVVAMGVFCQIARQSSHRLRAVRLLEPSVPWAGQLFMGRHIAVSRRWFCYWWTRRHERSLTILSSSAANNYMFPVGLDCQLVTDFCVLCICSWHSQDHFMLILNSNFKSFHLLKPWNCNVKLHGPSWF